MKIFLHEYTAHSRISMQRVNMEATSSNAVSSLGTGTSSEQRNIRNKWVLLMSKNPNSLFSKLSSCSNPKDLVSEMQQAHEKKDLNALGILLQLFVDLSSYTNVDVSKYSTESDIMKIVQHLDRNKESIFAQTGNYNLLYNNNKFRKFHNTISDYIALLFSEICKNTKSILEDDRFITISLNFLKQMSSSKNLALKHTGVFLALRIHTGLLSALKHYKHLSISNEDEIERDVEISGNTDSFVEKLRGYLEIVTKKAIFYNWTIQGKPRAPLKSMKLDCSEQFLKWIDILPELCLKDNYLACLEKSTCDPDMSIRKFALNVFLQIVDQEKYSKYITGSEKFLKAIKESVYDEQRHLRILAIDILATFEKYQRTLPIDIVHFLFYGIYTFEFPMAVAVGKYVINKIMEATNNPMEILRRVVMFQITTEEMHDIVKGNHHFLVEALIENLPVLREIQPYLELFESSLQSHENFILCEILLEATHEMFNGECSRNRPEKRKLVLKPNERQLFMKDLYEHIQKLGRYFQSRQYLPLVQLVKKYVCRFEGTDEGNQDILFEMQSISSISPGSNA